MRGMRKSMMHGHGCGPGFGMGRMMGTMCGRGFLTNEEKVEWLKEYADYLKKEAKGVDERIKELEKAK